MAASTSQDLAAFRVVLVTNYADARIMPLLKAELEGLGLEVVVVDHGEDEVIPRDLGAAARRTNSLAGFRVIVADKSVEVWIADRVTGKVVLREALEQGTSSKGAESVVVLRAVELLRVSLMELEAPHESRGQVAPPAELQKITGFPESKAVYAIGLGVGVGWVSPDLPVVPAVQLAFRLKLSKWFQLGVSGGTDLTPSTLEEEEGSVEISATHAAALAALTPLDSTALLQPVLSLGPGLVWTRIRGDANETFSEFSHDVLSPTIVADATLVIRASSAFRLWVGASPYLVFARPAVDINATRVASFSPVALRTSGGIQIAWP